MPSKRVIVLDRLTTQEVQFGNQSPQFWRYALWADVPVGRQAFYADPTKTSAFKSASAAETTALQNGSVVESVRTLQVDKGSTGLQLQAALQAEWTAYQNEITAFNPWNRYGMFWAGDGSSWTAGGAI